MPLKIKHVGFADLKRLVEIEIAAFESLEVFPLLCPDGVNASRQQAMRLAIKGVMVHDTTAKYMKVTSTEEHDKIVAFAKWHIPTKLQPRMTSSTTDPKAKYQVPAHGLKNQHGGLNKLLSSQSSNSRQRIMGQQPHCCKDPSICVPSHCILTDHRPGQNCNRSPSPAPRSSWHPTSQAVPGG